MKHNFRNLLIALGLILGISLNVPLFFNATKVDAKTNSGPSEVDIVGFEKGAENWQGGSLETDRVKQGKNSLKLTSQGFNWDANSTNAVNLDLSALTKNNLEMAILVYVDDPAQISGIRLDLGDNNQQFFYANQQNANFYQQGWNEIRFKPDQFLSQYEPTGWSEIKWLRVNLAAKDNSSTVSAWFDGWKLTNTPGPVVAPAVLGATTKAKVAVKGASTTSTIIDNFKNKLMAGDLITIIWVIVIFILIALGVTLILKRRTKKIKPQPVLVDPSKEK